MKVAIIGGAGVRVPLLTSGFLRFRDDLKIEELALWDINPERTEMIAQLSRAMVKRHGGAMRISVADSPRTAITDTSFVICSIRVGGAAGRIQDETIALKHGTVGQETVGAGGFCLALRTIPTMVDYARQVAEFSPKAWLLNFTNPVGIIAQACIEAGVGDRAIGVCDTPREQFESIAHALDVPPEKAFFDYAGLNHLGWVRRVLVAGEDRLPTLLRDEEKAARAYHVPFFEPDLLRRLGAFPTEYLYFYYYPARARDKTAARGTTRGQLIVELERRLVRELNERRDDPDAVLQAYDLYLARRSAGYMAVETGATVEPEQVEKFRRRLYQSAAGYDRIAIDVMRAIRNHRPTVMPVDVPNRGAIPELKDQDAVEVPCMIDGNGARPLATGPTPEPIRELLMQVKAYERLTARASREASATLAEEALALNPILESRRQARAILNDYRAAHRPHLDYLN